MNRGINTNVSVCGIYGYAFSIKKIMKRENEKDSGIKRLNIVLKKKSTSWILFKKNNNE